MAKPDVVDLNEVVLDLSNMSYEDAVRMSLLDAKLQRVQLIGERLKAGAATTELLDEMLALSSPASMESLFAATRDQMAAVAVNVPRSWFVTSAPPDLDFRNPETYKLLRADKAKELRIMIQRGQAEAKN